MKEIRVHVIMLHNGQRKIIQRFNTFVRTSGRAFRHRSPIFPIFLFDASIVSKLVFIVHKRMTFQ